MLKRVAMAMVAALAVGAAASAQTSGSIPAGRASQPSAQSQTSSAQTTQPPARPDPDTGDVRPATTTASGDTGLWFVPTAEILPAKRWSASAYRVNFDHQQGFTDVSNWPVTFGYGLKDRVELFGAWTLVRRIDRDVRPIFRPGNSQVGGLVNEYPFVSGGWSGNQLGDLWLGGKFNLMSEWQQKPMALAVRGMFKLPTASDEDEGVGTGKADFAFDLIASKEINQRVELSGFGGFIFRGDPDDVDISDGFRWGIGAAFPTRKSLRLTTELHGESQLDDVSYTGIARLIGEDGSIPPLVSDSDTATHFTVGLDLAGQGRVLRRRRGQLAFRNGRPRRRRVGVWQRVGRQLRLPGAHRVSPRCPRLHAATAANANTDAGTGTEAGSRARRQGVVRAVHG